MTSKHPSVLTFLVSGSALELTSTGTHGNGAGERGGTAVAAAARGTEETGRTSQAIVPLWKGRVSQSLTILTSPESNTAPEGTIMVC